MADIQPDAPARLVREKWCDDGRAALQKLQEVGVQAAFDAAVEQVVVRGVPLQVQQAVARRTPDHGLDEVESIDGREYGTTL